MSKKLYVGNLNYATTEERLREVFAPYGEILSAVVIVDRATGQSKGFGFVELADDDAAERAISTLGGREIDGRRVRVNEAEERAPRERRPFRPRDDFRPQGGFGQRDGYRPRDSYRQRDDYRPADGGWDGEQL